MERAPRELNPDAAARQVLFEQNRGYLETVAGSTIRQGLRTREFITVLIDVDDPAFALAVESIMPGEDWQAVRDRGEKPLVRAAASDAFAGVVSQVLPGLAAALHPDLVPGGCVRSLIMARRGFSVYHITPQLPEE